MTSSLDESFDHCRRLARRTGRNFYITFLTVSRPLLQDMCALYAFMRVTDDLGDNVSRSTAQRQAALSSWRRAVDEALAGEPPSHPVLPALIDVQHRHHFPVDALHAVIDGVEMDLDPQGFETNEELAGYCDLVAGAVGRCCIHIWGFDGDDAINRAIDCGRAFQLTNILRDIREDATNGRVYLPRDELQRFGLTTEDVLAGIRDDRMTALIADQVSLADAYYARAKELREMLQPTGRPIFTAMIRVYEGLLRRIERRQFDVFSQRIELPLHQKLWILGRSLWG